MSNRQPDAQDEQGKFVDLIERQAKQHLQARGSRHGAIWAGLGMSGLIGWAVVVPTVAGAMLGAYLDRRYPSVHSWTLTLLALGLVVGCIQAWRWVSEEDRSMHQRPGPGDE